MISTYSFGIYEGYNEIPVDVLRLFKPLIANPGKQIKYADEIIRAALKHNINLNNFSIDAYETKIEQNMEKNKYHAIENELHLYADDNTEDTHFKPPYGYINESSASMSLADKMKDAYESLDNDLDLIYAVNTIKALQEPMLIHNHIDLIEAIKQAIMGIPEAIETVTKVCNENTLVSEQIFTILSSNKTIEEIFG